MLFGKKKVSRTFIESRCFQPFFFKEGQGSGFLCSLFCFVFLIIFLKDGKMEIILDELFCSIENLGCFLIILDFDQNFKYLDARWSQIKGKFIF